MRPQIRSALVIAVLLAVTAGSAKAQTFFNDPEERFSGGSPRGRLFGAFGAISPIPRANVSFPGNYTPGTVVINTSERRLYYVLGDGQAIRYGIGVGRVGFT